MLKNFWYALAFSHEVTDKPMRIRCLAQDLVLFRTAAGTAQVMSDLCVHRGGALSDGWVEGDCVVCPYHGWEYATDGACTKIPANNPSVPIPKKARVDSYPTEERHGFIWAFLGDLPEAERPPIPKLDTFEDPEFRPVFGTWTWNASYTRVVENGCDISHTPWVHGSAFGNRDDPEIDDYDVEIIEGPDGEPLGAIATATLNPSPSKGLWGRLYGSEREPVTAKTAFFLPNINMIQITPPKIGKIVIYDTNIPVDESTTLTKWMALRNFFPKQWADANARKRVYRIFQQDAAIVEGIRPELLPYDLSAELHVKSDAMAIQFRKMRQHYFDKGWGIDAHSYAVDGPRREATVIPSPARREVPELAKAWINKEVPVRAPRTNGATASDASVEEDRDAVAE